MESIIVPFLGAVAFLLIISYVSFFSEQQKMQVKINHKLDLLMKHHGIEYMPPGGVPKELMPQIKQLVEDRKKVQAIKLLREHTGLSLLDAKNAVEKIEHTA